MGSVVDIAVTVKNRNHYEPQSDFEFRYFGSSSGFETFYLQTIAVAAAVAAVEWGIGNRHSWDHWTAHGVALVAVFVVAVKTQRHPLRFFPEKAGVAFCREPSPKKVG